MAVQIAGLAEDLIETARNNRGLLVDIVKTEVERAAAAIGAGSAAEVEALRRRVADLESALAETRRAASASGFPKKTAAKKSTAKKSAAKKTTAKKHREDGHREEGHREEDHREEGHREEDDREEDHRQEDDGGPTATTQRER